jgi:hypothetical protein
LHPVLLTFSLGRREIALHSYGLLIAAGLALGIWLAHREAGRRGLDQGRVLDLAFWLVVSGLVGSRLTYGLVNARSFFHACVDGDGPWWRGCTSLLAVWEGGLVFYGGVAAAAVVALVFARREGWSFGQVGDLFAPALAIGHAFGRLGCFAAGCCFGKETASRIGVAFPRGSVAFDVLQRAGAVPVGAGETSPRCSPCSACCGPDFAAGRARCCSATSAFTPCSGSWSRSFAAICCADFPSSWRRLGWPPGSACRPPSRSSSRPDSWGASSPGWRWQPL